MIYVHQVSPENMPPLAFQASEGEPHLLALQSVEGEPHQVRQTQSLYWGRHQYGAERTQTAAHAIAFSVIMCTTTLVA